MSKISFEGTIKSGVTIAVATFLAVGCKTTSQWWQGTRMAKDQTSTRVVGFEIKKNNKFQRCDSIASSGNKGMRLFLEDKFTPDQSIKLSINFAPGKAQTSWADFSTGCGRENYA